MVACGSTATAPDWPPTADLASPSCCTWGCRRCWFEHLAVPFPDDPLAAVVVRGQLPGVGTLPHRTADDGSHRACVLRRRDRGGAGRDDAVDGAGAGRRGGGGARRG